MSRSTPQFHFTEDQSSELSRQDKTRHRLDLSTPHDPESLPDNTHQITNLSQNGQNNGASKRRLQDHPEWSTYLADRHILDPAIAAGAWIERDQYARQDVLVWREKRRDGSPGATRRRLLKPVSLNGKKEAKVRWQFRGQKTDEPFHTVGTLDELKHAIAHAAGLVHIVEGEADAWSLHPMDICNVIGIYGITAIPKDIDSIFNELGITRFVYFADNDAAGEQGASNLRTILHESGWAGVQEYRKFVGPGIPDKGDANDLLCHHFPDLLAARAALDTLPAFLPKIKRQRVRNSITKTDHDQAGWDAVNEAVRIALGVDRFKSNGYSKNIHCPNPRHEDKNPSAAWHKDGYCTCFSCGETFNTKQVAEWLGIDWRALRWSKLKIVFPNDINLDAAPEQTDTRAAPLAFEQAPDSWLRLLNKFFTPADATLFHFALPLCNKGPLATGFTVREFIQALRPLACNVNDRTIYHVFQNVRQGDNQPFFAKIDPGEGSISRNCKFRLRSHEDIRRRLAHSIRYRVYEKKFSQHRDILIEFKVFAEALQGSEFAITLESALEPLYKKQKQRYESQKQACEQEIAGYEVDLDNLSSTPLPDWPIEQPCEFPALLARGIYDADPRDRSKTEWARRLGNSEANVDAILKRAGIQRTSYTIKKEVDSQRDARNMARKHGAKITGIEVNGVHKPYEAAMDIPEGSRVILQPPARHEIVSEEKPSIKSPPRNTAPFASSGTQDTTRR